MTRKAITQFIHVVLIVGIVWCLFGVAQAATGNIDPTNKWAWGTNVGWLNFRPEHGGATVYSDHLEGYVWGENIGWILLGTHEGGGAHTYLNTTKDNYGVNRDGSGNLSGYAWGTNVGWINFDPADGGVTIDPVTGRFDGYAWGESIGWIHFRNTDPAYNVVTSFRPEATGNIDADNKWAWGTNVGWINFAPTDGGATVYSDHLEGDAWGERIGWIRLGTHQGGGAHTYLNTATDDYGINNDGCGNLSGYAWSTNTRWVNFNPSDSQVTVDPISGDFDGFAWAENVGWIHFSGTAQDSTAYKVNTAWRGDLTATYQNNVAAIIRFRRPDPASSGGLIVANSSFLYDSGDCIIFGHDNGMGTTNTYLTEITPTVKSRWVREWQLDKHDEATTANGNVHLMFDFSDAGHTTTPVEAANYRLIKRADSSSNFSIIVAEASSLLGNRVIFYDVDASDLGSLFTLGTRDVPGSPEIDVQRPASTSIADGGTDNVGNQAVGTVNLSYTIDNTAGTAALSVNYVTPSNLSNCSNFSVTGLPLIVAAGVTGTLDVSFDVDASGAFSLEMDIANNDANENPYDIAITGMGAGGAPEIDVQRPGGTSIADPGTDNVGNQAVGTVNLSYTIDNTAGTAELSVTGVTASNLVKCSNFVVGTTLPLDVAAGGTATLDVSFDVDANDAFSLDMDIANDDADESQYDVAITGTGAGGAPEIDVQRPAGTSIADGGADALGSKPVGAVNLQYTIDNTAGTAELSVGGVTASNLVKCSNFSVGTTLPLDVAAGVTATLDVSFDVDANGAFSLDMNTANNDADRDPYHIAITGTGTGGAPEIDVEGNSVSIADEDTSPDSGDHTEFGNVSVGDSSDRTFTIQNEGTDTLTLTDFPDAVSLSAGDFTVQTQPSSGSIAAGGADLTFVVRCTPSGTGVLTATVSIANNDSDEDPYNFDVKCTGIAPEMDVKGNSVSIADGDDTPDPADHTDFGDVSVGNDFDRTFTIQNEGTDTLILTHFPDAVSLSAGDFTVQTQPSSGSIAAGSDDLTFVVRCTPSGTGVLTATVSIANNDSGENPYNFDVKGTGIAPNLVITKTVDPATANPGEPITYTLVFSNTGTDVATGVVITDIVPVSVTNTSVISSGVAITDTGYSPPYVWEVADLAVGEGGVITITGQLSTTLAAGTAFTNTAVITTTTVDANPGNNSGYAVVTIIMSDLVITKTVTPATANPGDPITYTITFSNIGSDVASGVVITDVVPVSMTVTSVISSGVAITDTGVTPPYVWDVADLAVGEGGVITITGQLSATLTTSTFTNTVVITTTAADANPDNNSSDVVVTVIAGGTAETATGTGTADFRVGSGRIEDLAAVAEGTLTCPAIGLVFPHGFFSFNVTGLTPCQHETVVVTITLPSAIPTDTQYWKCHDGAWLDVTSLLGDNDGDNVLTLTLTDGELGDDDGVCNGEIVDPGGPGQQPRVPIGGVIVPVNKLELLALRLRSGQAPWLGLAMLASLAALLVALVRRRGG